MTGFKDIIASDVHDVFQNTGEFAELSTVEYNGATYSLPLIMDRDTTVERSKNKEDHVQGLFLCDAVVYIAQSDMNTVPRKNVRIKINGERFTIEKVGSEMGEIVLYLSQFAE
ncbi:hypothetical protein FACS1894127_6350 [Clostridia bacterium]|nr:hypothetical protein FACS1894127_6350 [Clostridia bacterium]